MNPLKLKGFRVSKGKTQRDCGEMIEKNTDTYAKKERGEVEITLFEALVLAIGLEMEFSDFNAIFFDGDLPFRNIEKS